MGTRVRDVRRLTGRSYLLDRAGVAGELVFDPPRPSLDEVVERLEAVLAKALAATGLPAASVHTRPDGRGTGLTVAFPAPEDRLDPAADLLEEVLEHVAEAIDAQDRFALRLVDLRDDVDQAAQPALVALLAEAERRGVPAVHDDEGLTLGLGARGRTWPLDALPGPDQVPWEALGWIPVTLITGTNGKTTTTRMLTAILAAAGHVVGRTSTVGRFVGDERLEEGDWSGPWGARTVLRDPRVTAAVLETARGGLLRRGLVLSGYAVGVITNVSDDHYGDYGIHDRLGMASVKAVVGHGVGPTGAVVVMGDDPELQRIAFAARRIAFAADRAGVASHLAAGGLAWFVADDALVRARGEEVRVLLDVADIPFAFGGAAPHNVLNALAAAAAADALGVDAGAIARGLAQLRPTPEELPGRNNVFARGTTRVVLDFAHNPASVQAVLAFAARACPSEHVMVSLGMPGDRADDDLAAVADTVADVLPAEVLVRELDPVRRGRAPMEVPHRLADRLSERGVTKVDFADDDVSAVASAVERAPEGATIVVLAVIDLPGVAADLLGKGFTAAP